MLFGPLLMRLGAQLPSTNPFSPSASVWTDPAPPFGSYGGGDGRSDALSPDYWNDLASGRIAPFGLAIPPVPMTAGASDATARLSDWDHLPGFAPISPFDALFPQPGTALGISDLTGAFQPPQADLTPRANELDEDLADPSSRRLPVPVPKPPMLPKSLAYGEPDARARDPDHPWRDQTNVSLRQYLAQMEHSTISHPESDGYADARDGIALGRYELQPTQALRDIGWTDGRGNWTAAARAHGVRSNDDFLKNRQAQELADELYMRSNEAHLRNSYLKLPGAETPPQSASVWDLATRGQQFIGQDGNHITLSPAGVAASAHKEGATATANDVRWLAQNGWNVRGKSVPDQDLNRSYRNIAGRLSGA
jgi:hypothetical protein